MSLKFSRSHSLFLFSPPVTLTLERRRNQALTGADGCVVAGTVLTQGSGALGGEGGSSTNAGTALPALSTGDGTCTPGGPLICLSIYCGKNMN